MEREFKIGDKITWNVRSYRDLPGIIVDIGSTNYGVDFGITNGPFHRLGGLLRHSTGRWLLANEMTLVCTKLEIRVKWLD